MTAVMLVLASSSSPCIRYNPLGAFTGAGHHRRSAIIAHMTPTFPCLLKSVEDHDLSPHRVEASVTEILSISCDKAMPLIRQLVRRLRRPANGPYEVRAVSETPIEPGCID